MAGLTEKMFKDLRDKRHKFDVEQYGQIEAFKESVFQEFLKACIVEAKKPTPKPKRSIKVKINPITVSDPNSPPFLNVPPHGTLPCL